MVSDPCNSLGHYKNVYDDDEWSTLVILTVPIFMSNLYSLSVELCWPHLLAKPRSALLRERDWKQSLVFPHDIHRGYSNIRQSTVFSHR